MSLLFSLGLDLMLSVGGTGVLFAAEMAFKSSVTSSSSCMSVDPVSV